MYTDRPLLRRQYGLSLIELLVFIVIVSVCLTALLGVFNLTLRSSADPLVQKQALAIAESVLEEVAAKPYTWCDPDDANAATATSAAGCTVAQGLAPQANESRTDFAGFPYDNVGDYNGFSMIGITSPADATPLPGLGGYSAKVTVSQAGANAAFNLTAGDVLQIDVAVWAPNRNMASDAPTLTLTGYRFRYAPTAY